jgi:DNA polymerase-1
MAQLLDASAEKRPKGYYQLDSIVERMLGLTLDKHLQQSDWSGDLSSEQVLYAARDAAVMLPLVAALRTACTNAGLDRVYATESQCLPALAWLEQTGVLIDDEAWTERALMAERQAGVFEAELCALLHQRVNETGIPHKHRVKKQDVITQLAPEGIVWDSPAQVQSVLRCLGYSVASTAEAILTALAPDEPLAAKLLEHRDARQRMKLVGAEWLRKYLSPLSKRVHADYLQIGTRPGRMSCIKPNMQQIPKTTEYRSSIIAAPEHVLIKADYSQIELRVGAVIAPEPKMLHAYETGADLHRLTAMSIFRCAAEAVTPEQRALGKAINFGLLFGMGAPRLRQEIFTNTKQTVSEAEAHQFKEAFRRHYPGIAKWHDMTGHAQRKHGTIDTRSLTGRRRLGVFQYTELLNTPVQASAADGMKVALARLYAHRHEVPSARPILVVHDELVLEVAREHADEAAQWLKHHMEAGMSEVVDGKVPIEVETTTGRTWAGSPL